MHHGGHLLSVPARCRHRHVQNPARAQRHVNHCRATHRICPKQSAIPRAPRYKMSFHHKADKNADGGYSHQRITTRWMNPHHPRSLPKCPVPRPHHATFQTNQRGSTLPDQRLVSRVQPSDSPACDLSVSACFGRATHVVAGLHFDPVPGREERVEADDERRVTAEQTGDSCDDSWRVDTADNTDTVSVTYQQPGPTAAKAAPDIRQMLERKMARRHNYQRKLIHHSTVQ